MKPTRNIFTFFLSVLIICSVFVLLADQNLVIAKETTTLPGEQSGGERLLVNILSFSFMGAVVWILNQAIKILRKLFHKVTNKEKSNS